MADNFDGVPCPVPGLDRCNNGNTLASPTVSPDPGRELTVFVSFATRTADGNENIIVRASEDGGLTFPVRAIANDTVHQARRFMPWSCAVSEGVYVGWYDREPATAANNDLTRYHAAFLRYRPDNILSTTESLTPFRPVDVSRGVADQQCSFWPSPPRNIGILKTARGSRSYRGGYQGPGETAPRQALHAATSRIGDSDPIFGLLPWLGKPEIRRLQRDCVCRPARLYRVGECYAAGRSSCPSRKLCWNVLRCPDPCRDNNDSLWRVGRLLRHLGRGRIDFQRPDELCDIRVPVPKLCEKVIACPVCDRNRLCTGNDGFVLQGLPRESTLALVDDHERAVQRASTVTATSLRLQSLRELFASGSDSLALQIRIKNAPSRGKQSIKVMPQNDR